MKSIYSYLGIVLCAGLLLTLQACSNGSNDPAVVNPDPVEVVPIVFVHGQYGSAQQFETQALRFTSNGYPADMLFAFEYDTSSSDNPLAALDAFIDQVLARTGAEKVYAVGHSRGTTVWVSYLEDPAFDGPAKVARYVNIDGRTLETLPGGVPTIGIWGEWNSAGSGHNLRDDTDAQIGPFPGSNYHFPGKSHTETATSPEAFALMYGFLTGAKPVTTEVVPNTSDTVAIAGRAVVFPQNEGFEGAQMTVWRIDPASGHRTGEEEVYSASIGSGGDFGPVTLTRGEHYEFALRRPATEQVPAVTVHHFYPEPFIRDNHLFRLQSSRAGQGIEGFLPADEEATGFVVQRQREFWGDQGAASDELFIDGLNVLTPAISPRDRGQGSGVNLAVFLYDQGGDRVTDLERGPLPPFNSIIFFTAADVFVPAMFDGGGTVSVDLVTRGGARTSLKVPNWPSSTDRISLMFNDFPQ